VGQDLEIYVPLAGLIDVDAERERLGKELARTDQELSSVLRKLENPNFVAKAPAEVVEKDRARVEELQARKTKLQENIDRLAPEAPMSQETTPEAEDTLANPQTGQVKVAPPSAPSGGDVDLSKELKGELESSADIVNPQITDALNKLRESTKEGLSAKDHEDLGVAYMSMGLVDEAKREFEQAKQRGEASAEPVKAEAEPAAAEEAPAKKAPAKKAPAKKAVAVAAPTKKAAAKGAPAKKAAAKKAPAKKTAMKAPAKKTAMKKAPAKKTAAKKARR
jgi:valyl-tRNA synthetase